MTPAKARTELHGVLVVDKSDGPTSHDVVAVARRALGTREVGHTGTLDPMATGVLVLVVGEATKLVTLLGAQAKRYTATIKLGSETSTLDARGEVVAEADVPALRRETVVAAAESFLGETDQRAPVVSAIKVDGRSLHKRARAGEIVEAPVRRVRLDSVDVVALNGAEITIALDCGKGFYVRSLARDLAQALETRGHLTALRRLRNGPFSSDSAVSFDALRAAAFGTEDDRALLRAALIPFRAVCASLPHLVLPENACVDVRHGRRVTLAGVALDDVSWSEPRIALDEQGTPVAIVTREGDSLRVQRGFRH